MIDSRVEALVRRLPTVAAVLLCTFLLGWTQFSFDGLTDTDSYFHTRAARELDQHGLRKQFPQTVFSTWHDRYSDKDFLYHVLLVPFQRLHHWRQSEATGPDTDDLVTPGKQAVVFFDLLFFSALAYALCSMGARFPWLWLMLFFVADAPILYRLLLVRPGLLGVTLLLVEIALLVRRKPFWLAGVGALHVWAHSSFVLLPAVVLLALAAHLVRREPFPRRLLIFGLLGPVVATLVHPYFPNNLTVGWDQIVEVARGVWWGRAEIPDYLFGSELRATKTNLFLGTFPVFLPAVGGIVAFLAFPRRRLSTDGLAMVLIVGLLLVLSFLSERFLLFFFPAAALLGARLWSELLQGVTLGQLRRRNVRAFSAVVGLLALCLLAGLSDGSVLSLRIQVARLPTSESLRPAIEFLNQRARPEDRVYHNFWWDFSALYHFRPDGRYVVALDPVFFYRKDPELFRKSLEAYEGRTDDLYRVLKEDFGATWVFLPKTPQYQPFFNLIRRDQRFRKAYEDDHAVIARL